MCGNMLSRTVNRFLQHTGSGLIFKYHNSTSLVLSNSDIAQLKMRDPAPFFFDKEVQQLLTDLTRAQDEIVFKTRKDGRQRKPPQYKFMTDNDLQEATEVAHMRAKKVLQMPPVVLERMKINKILEEDPHLRGYDRSNYVFTDVSFGIDDRDRLIAVRESNGQLRLANWDERDRMNCIYFGMNGREVERPGMFGRKLLQRLLEQEKYTFVLDRACVQFEPDDPRYQSTTAKVYNYVNDMKHYEHLRSTRHFGPMVFYLVWNNIIDDLIIDVVQNGRIDEAVSLIRLFCKIYSPVIQRCGISNNIHDDVRYIEDYCEHCAVKGEAIANTLRMHQRNRAASKGT